MPKSKAFSACLACALFTDLLLREAYCDFLHTPKIYLNRQRHASSHPESTRLTGDSKRGRQGARVLAPSTRRQVILVAAFSSVFLCAHALAYARGSDHARARRAKRAVTTMRTWGRPSRACRSPFRLRHPLQPQMRGHSSCPIPGRKPSRKSCHEISLVTQQPWHDSSRTHNPQQKGWALG